MWRINEEDWEDEELTDDKGSKLGLSIDKEDDDDDEVVEESPPPTPTIGSTLTRLDRIEFAMQTAAGTVKTNLLRDYANGQTNCGNACASQTAAIAIDVGIAIN